ncbi:MAG: hypothetical protein IAE94_06445 [Chthoniobacterales bacterium]|nr:hypothetical protein [Chthoniobacterales bacterium]
MRFPKLFSLVVAAIFPAVSGVTFGAVDAATPRLVIDSSPSLHIQSARIEKTKKGWRISGRIDRQFGYAAIPGSHLCLTVVGADGQVIQERVASIHQNPHPRVLGAWTRRTTFVETISAPPTAVITITPHATAKSKCRAS